MASINIGMLYHGDNVNIIRVQVKGPKFSSFSLKYGFKMDITILHALPWSHISNITRVQVNGAMIFLQYRMQRILPRWCRVDFGSIVKLAPLQVLHGKYKTKDLRLLT